MAGFERSLLAAVLVALAFTACRTDTRTPGTLTGQTATDSAREPALVCEEGCARLRECAPELPPEESIASRMLPTCTSQCEPFAEHVHAQSVARRLDDCLAAPACELFDACVSSDPLAVWTRLVAPVGGNDCASLCTRVGACERACEDCEQDGGESPESEREARCVVACEAEGEAERREAMLACADHGTCGALGECLDEITGSPGQLQPVLGVHPACSRFCDRSISCGVEESGAGSSTLDDVKSSMTSARVECAVACMSTLDEPKAAELEACAAEEDCAQFWKCADDQ